MLAILAILVLEVMAAAVAPAAQIFLRCGIVATLIITLSTGEKVAEVLGGQLPSPPAAIPATPVAPVERLLVCVKLFPAELLGMAVAAEMPGLRVHQAQVEIGVAFSSAAHVLVPYMVLLALVVLAAAGEAVVLGKTAAPTAAVLAVLAAALSPDSPVPVASGRITETQETLAATLTSPAAVVVGVRALINGRAVAGAVAVAGVLPVILAAQATPAILVAPLRLIALRYLQEADTPFRLPLAVKLSYLGTRND